MRKLKILFLYVSRALGLFALARRGLKGKLLILCYHGIQLADEAKFKPKLFMSPALFSRRMRLLGARNMAVMPLGEALSGLAQGRLPENAVAITIDDGFHSTFAAACPLLQESNFPATVYVTSYYAEKGTPIFRLAVQYMFWKTRDKVIELKETPWGQSLSVDSGDAQARDAAVADCTAYGEAHCSEEERQELLDWLGEALQVDMSSIRASRILSLASSDEIRQWSSRGIDIQLHTHRHNFPEQDEALAVKEIEENREFLCKVTDKPLEHFCYPSGIWNTRQWPWLESLGIKSATTCEAGYNGRETPVLGLKRFLDSEDISEIEYLSELSGFSEYLRRMRSILRRGNNGFP